MRLTHFHNSDWAALYECDKYNECYALQDKVHEYDFTGKWNDSVEHKGKDQDDWKQIAHSSADSISLFK